MNSALKLEETFWHHSELGELDSNLNSATCLLCELGQVKMHFLRWEVKNVPAWMFSIGENHNYRKHMKDFINFKVHYKC